MEEGVKEDPAPSKGSKFVAKAGWVKKAPGRLLASYKDRYVHVEKTEILVYEHEDLKNCLEKLDLENYDKCHELKSPFTKKHRLILIRSSKPGNKVHDVKFQAQTAEEKEAWIKALLDGINRAKNKVFDEVMVDDSSNLEHVTRTRPKGNRNRRPPTRIHMKEVADVSSDGILRLDLDLEDAMMPNGTNHSVDGPPPKAAPKAPSAGEWEAPTDPEVNPPKKILKPPMPPSKEVKPSAEESTEGEISAEPEVSPPPPKKVLKPPMPPTKEAKPSAVPEEEPETEEVPQKKILKPPMPPSKEVKPSAEESTEESEKSPDIRKKAGPPPTPPNKPTNSGSVSNLAESDPPAPPSKEKKPSITAVELDPEVQNPTDEIKENEEVAEDSISEQDIGPDDKPEESSESEISGSQISTESPKKSPILTHQKATENTDENATIPQINEERDSVLADPPQVEDESSPKSEESSVSLSPLLCHPEKKKKTEEKSVDSGQHSDDDSEESANEDPLLASTVALRGSRPNMEVLDDIQPQVSPKVVTPLKPSIKSKSASIGDLLLPEIRVQSGENVVKLETEVALEMEETRELLSKVSGAQGPLGEGEPEDLLTEAMEKLKKADHVLREVNKLKLAKNPSERKSW